MDKITTIVLKEWAEVFRKRIVLFTVTLLPLVITAIPLITLAFAGATDDFEEQLNQPGGEEFFADLCTGLEQMDCIEYYTLNIFMLMFMILPIAIPITIAAYSIVGEKTSRSLEPLLATPITTVELLAGKAIAAAVPAILATWLAFGIFIAGAYLMVSPEVFDRLIEPLWFVAIFILGPLLTLMAIAVAMMISSRASDPRVAEQLATIVILPLILVVVGQASGLFLVNLNMVIIAVFFVIVLDAVLLYLAVRLFQRETILTRWH